MDVTDIQFQHILARSEFDRLIGPDMRAVGACIDQTLAQAGAHPKDIDVAVRTGGSSRVSRVVDVLAQRFGPERIHTMDAFSSVGAGLGIAAWAQAQQRS